MSELAAAALEAKLWAVEPGPACWALATEAAAAAAAAAEDHIAGGAGSASAGELARVRARVRGEFGLDFWTEACAVADTAEALAATS